MRTISTLARQRRWPGLSEDGSGRNPRSEIAGYLGQSQGRRLRFQTNVGEALLALLLALAFAAPAAHAQGRDQKRDYQLLPSDLIRVQVFQEPDLDREVRVSQEGEIFLPLIGKIEVQGRTLRQLEETVRELYDRDYLVNPQINIIVMEYQPRMVNVMGAVNSPGALEFPPEQSITVIDAISRAGGFNRLADRRRVRLTRTYAGGRVENFVINADELMSGASAEPWVVLKDDVIFVPERVL